MKGATDEETGYCIYHDGLIFGHLRVMIHDSLSEIASKGAEPMKHHGDNDVCPFHVFRYDHLFNKASGPDMHILAIIA